MRTSLILRGASKRRVVAALAAAALPLGILAVGSPASAHESTGSAVEVFLDSTGSNDLADAIQNGWWGHEGANDGTGTGTTYPDLNAADPDLASVFPDPSKIRVAFVTSSAGLDGTAEKPAVTGTKSVDQVFPWFMDASVGTGLNGTTLANDSVNIVSTGAEYDAWFAAGQPVQGFNNNLQVLDATAPGTPVSANPKGKSILNRWAAGAHISMVFYATTGASVNGKPVVAVDGTGHAITAYVPFVTAAKPGDSVRTSAGYQTQNFGAVAVSTTTTLATNLTSPQPSGTPIDLTATVAPASGPAAVGSVEFFDGGTSLGTANLAGGTATKSNVTLPVGSHSLTAVYTPTNTQTLAFNGSTSAAKSFSISATATSTAAGAVPGADTSAPVSLSAQVTPAGVAGSVVWTDGGTVVAGTPAGGAAVNASGFASANGTFNVPGTHTVTATFTPTSSTYASSTGTVTFDISAPAGTSTDIQSIKATVLPGTITVTTPYTPSNPLDVGTLALTPGLNGLKGSAPFEHIRVVDTRAGAKPWALTALAGNLTAGAGKFINGQNVGLTGLTAYPTSNAGLGTITLLDNAVPAAPVAPGDAGSLGLGGVPHTVFSANQGPSDVEYSGLLTIFAPTTTVTGLYTGTITFTAS